MSIDKEINDAMRVCGAISDHAKAEGDLPTMYAVNRAWHELNSAREDRISRTLAHTNGERT